MFLLFDLDGTICNIEHRLHHIKKDIPNWESFNDACEDDDVYGDIQFLWQTLYAQQGVKLIIITGRMDTHREQTEDWLEENGLMYDMLLMRPAGDFRSDVDIKRGHIENIKRITKRIIAFDDRDKVVELYREMGIRCLQVRKGDY